MSFIFGLILITCGCLVGYFIIMFEYEIWNTYDRIYGYKNIKFIDALQLNETKTLLRRLLIVGIVILSGLLIIYVGVIL